MKTNQPSAFPLPAAPVTTPRNSSVEGLRILSIVLITLMHMAGYVYNTQQAANTLGVIALNTFGNMGVTVFMLISGYYGIRASLRKGLALWGVVWFYSVLDYVTGIAVTHGSIDPRDWPAVLLPVCGRRFWFITYYLVIFCLSPFLNRAKELPRRSFLGLLGVLGGFFVLAPTLLIGDIDRNGGKGLANLILVYLVGQYLRTYGFPRFKRAACCSPNLMLRIGMKVLERLTPTAVFVLSSGCILVSSIVIERLTHHVYIPWGRDNSLFILTAACALLCMALQRPRSSRTVNYLAGFALPLYLQNQLLLRWLHKQYDTLANDPALWGPFILTAAEIVVLAWVIENGRRLLCRPFAASLLDRAERLFGSVRH